MYVFPIYAREPVWCHRHESVGVMGNRAHSISVALSPAICTPCPEDPHKQEGPLTRSLCPQ